MSEQPKPTMTTSTQRLMNQELVQDDPIKYLLSTAMLATIGNCVYAYSVHNMFYQTTYKNDTIRLYTSSLHTCLVHIG